MATDPASSQGKLSDERLLTLVQRQTFQYCWEGAEPNSLAIRERYHVDQPALGRMKAQSHRRQH